LPFIINNIQEIAFRTLLSCSREPGCVQRLALDDIAFGSNIVGMDQCDLYVEKLHTKDDTQYEYRGESKKLEVVREEILVKGSQTPQTVELKYTLHGPVIHEDLKERRAYALKSVGSLPGTAGYFAALSLGRARNWQEFGESVRRYKVPSENLVYADRQGNIGWIAAGLMPIRKNWSGLLPVPGHTGEYEWSGFLSPDQLPMKFNPLEGYIFTANANILRPGYLLRLLDPRFGLFGDFDLERRPAAILPGS
jgi:penicillin G amidase